MRAFPIMRASAPRSSSTSRTACSCRAAGDGVTAGQAEYIEPLARAGVAVGVDGVFLEVHEDPARARSDAQNALPLDAAGPLLRQLVRHPRADRRGPRSPARSALSSAPRRPATAPRPDGRSTSR